jgi:hypothetical protein
MILAAGRPADHIALILDQIEQRIGGQCRRDRQVAHTVGQMAEILEVRVGVVLAAS